VTHLKDGPDCGFYSFEEISSADDLKQRVLNERPIWLDIAESLNERLRLYDTVTTGHGSCIGSTPSEALIVFTLTEQHYVREYPEYLAGVVENETKYAIHPELVEHVGVCFEKGLSWGKEGETEMPNDTFRCTVCGEQKSGRQRVYAKVGYICLPCDQELRKKELKYREMRQG
jgi:hypothetical protein